MTETISFSKFGKSFQEKLCQLILEDRPFADRMQEVMQTSFLELHYLQVFTRKVFDYRLKYKTHPSYNILTTILRTELDDESEIVQKQVREYFARLTVNKFNVRDSAYIKETSLDFCKKQVLKEAILKSVKLLQKSSFSEIQKLINEAMLLGIDNEFGHELIKDFEERYKPRPRNPVSTGWDTIDAIIKMGLGQKELGVVIAATGGGKSQVLVHLGAVALLLGKTVVHYTLELADLVVGQRYDSRLSGFSLNELTEYKEEIYEKLATVPGKLIIKEYPGRSATTNTIRNHLEKLRQSGEEIGLIIVDYGDLLKPINVTKEKRHDLETIYEELRAIAQEELCPVWTASQTNRSGLNADIITMESISEAFSKCFPADFIFSVSRTIDDKKANSGRIFIAKNRNGIDGVVYPAYIDWSRVKIDVLEAIGDDDQIMPTMKTQQETLAEKYKKYKAKKKDK